MCIRDSSELGTINAIYNFSNTYFEILAAKGEGIGAELVKQSIQEKGEGLTGLVLGSDNLQDCENQISNKHFKSPPISTIKLLMLLAFKRSETLSTAYPFAKELKS